VPLTIIGSFNIFSRTDKWIHWHPLTLIIHEPIQPQGKGNNNLKVLLEESYKVIESSLPGEYRGYIKNEDQDVF